MNDKFDRLISLIDQLLLELHEHEHYYWHQWFSKSKELIESNDVYGLQKILDAYGGMGSFNDILIIKNGKLDQRANQRLQNLASKVFETASAMRRSHDE